MAATPSRGTVAITDAMAMTGASVRRSPRSPGRPPWMEQPHPAVVIGKGLLLAVIALAMLFPFVYVVSVSFSSYEDVVGGQLVIFPLHPTLDAYETVLAGGVVTQALKVSIGLTAVGPGQQARPLRGPLHLPHPAWHHSPFSGRQRARAAQYLCRPHPAGHDLRL